MTQELKSPEPAAGKVRRRRRLVVSWERVFLVVGTVFSYLFLLSPMIVVIGASLNAGTEYYAPMTFPPEDPTFRWYFEIPTEHLRALGLSFALGLVATFGACLIGIPAALGLVRSNVPFKSTIFAVFRAPLQIPSVVIGIAFLQLYYVIFDYWNIELPGTFIGLAIGHTFVATPYVVGSVVTILQRFDTRLEEAAIIHGASPFRVLRTITLPVIMPGVYVGSLYAFMVSFADVPVSIFLSSPGFSTYPIELFYSLENDFNPAILASASLVILICLVMLLIIQRLVGFDTLLRSSGGR
jgi:putative spermidine/putrescine transport system permease protein